MSKMDKISFAIAEQPLSENPIGKSWDENSIYYTLGAFFRAQKALFNSCSSCATSPLAKQGDLPISFEADGMVSVKNKGRLNYVTPAAFSVLWKVEQIIRSHFNDETLWELEISSNE